MAHKTGFNYRRPSVFWRESRRAEQQTQEPLNSPRLTKSKESKQTERKAQAQSKSTDTRPRKA